MELAFCKSGLTTTKFMLPPTAESHSPPTATATNVASHLIHRSPHNLSGTLTTSSCAASAQLNDILGLGRSNNYLFNHRTNIANITLNNHNSSHINSTSSDTSNNNTNNNNNNNNGYLLTRNHSAAILNYSNNGSSNGYSSVNQQRITENHNINSTNNNRVNNNNNSQRKYNNNNNNINNNNKNNNTSVSDSVSTNSVIAMRLKKNRRVTFLSNLIEVSSANMTSIPVH